MNQNEEYIEINLKDILFHILYHWKIIIAVAVTAALLLGSFQAVRENQAAMSTDNGSDHWLEYQRYQEQLTLCEDRIASTQDKIDTLQDYMDHAVLMKADYRNVYIAKATYYIDSDYKIMPEVNYQNPDKTYTLTWYYKNFLEDYSVYQEIGEKVGIEAKYLMDLVSIWISNSNTLFITASHPNEDYSQQIMEALQEKLYEVHNHLDSTIGKHTLTLMLNTCGVYVDETLKDRQQSVYDEMISYQDTLIDQKAELESLEEEGAPEAPNALKAFLKWFVLGGIAGGALMVFCMAVPPLLSIRVYFPDALSSRYNLPVLGSIVHNSKKIDVITRWLRKQEGRLNQNSKENDQFLAANLKNHCADAREILLCNDISISESALVADTLHTYLPEISLSAAGSITNDANALLLLPQCDTVIIVVTGKKSRNKDISKMLTMIHDCGKPTAGFVFID